MNTNRTIKSILYATPMDMGGMPIRQAFPSQKAESIDPFLLLHHADIKVPTHVEVKTCRCWSTPAPWLFSCEFYFQRRCSSPR